MGNRVDPEITKPEIRPTGIYKPIINSLIKNIKMAQTNFSGPVNSTNGFKTGGTAHSHYIVAAGDFTTVGGDAVETTAVSGALTTDDVLVTLKNEGASPVTLDAASISEAGVLHCIMSGDPSTDHDITYVVLREV